MVDRRLLPRGVYGMHVDGLDSSSAMMVQVRADAPRLRVVQSPFGWSEHGNPSGVYDLVDGGRLAIFAEADLCVFTLPYVVSDDEILHPWLVSAICDSASRLGRLAIHGGVLGFGTHAVAVVGARGAGKSTLMAAAAAARLRSEPMLFGTTARQVPEVLADDLVVVEGDTVFPGPRCVDLRPSSVEFFSQLVIRPSRNDSRFRVVLPPCVPEARLVGFVVLEWAAEVSMVEVPAAHRIPALLDHLSAGNSRREHEAVLRLAEKPVWVLRRPRDPALLDGALGLIADAVAGRATESVPASLV